jgi:hypothetical protein
VRAHGFFKKGRKAEEGTLKGKMVSSQQP